jgi:Fe2+ transport system protein B
MTQLLTAPHIITPKLPHSWLSYNRSIEETASERFNVRDRDRGLNVDFMSYANWHLANKNSEALLNTTTLLQHSEKTLQTFFKHFVHTGTWGSGRHRAAYGSVNSPDYVNGTFTQRIDVLTMNETATWISLAILILLMVILVVLIVGLQVVYPSSCMQHHVECLADVLTMVAGSDALISLIEEQGVENFAKSGRMTRLAWFKDRRGDVRWGVELVDAEGVEWIDGPGEVESDGDEVEESLLWSGQVVDAGGLGRFLHSITLGRSK